MGGGTSPFHAPLLNYGNVVRLFTRSPPLQNFWISHCTVSHHAETCFSLVGPHYKARQHYMLYMTIVALRTLMARSFGVANCNAEDMKSTVLLVVVLTWNNRHIDVQKCLCMLWFCSNHTAERSSSSYVVKFNHI